MTLKVQNPKTLDRSKMKHWPRWSEPKIDGCRAYNPEGTLLGRSQKQHANRYVTAQFSTALYVGLDGEMAAAHECNPALCRITTSAMSTQEGEPFVLWHCFDYLTPETVELPYGTRYSFMRAKIEDLQRSGHAMQLRVVPYVICNSMEEIDAAHEKWLDMGYEGSVVWDPSVKHKEGASSPTQRGALRIKDFIDFEAEIIGYTEGERNDNEAQTNELGRTFRTSHQENKIPNGMIGNLKMRALQDVYDLQVKTRLLIAKDSEFICAPGALTHDQRLDFFRNPHKILGQIAKAKFFPKGMKDKPRFPQFFSFRSKEDL